MALYPDARSLVPQLQCEKDREKRRPPSMGENLPYISFSRVLLYARQRRKKRTRVLKCSTMRRESGHNGPECFLSLSFARRDKKSD